MAGRRTLKDVEREHGESLHQLIPRLVEENEGALFPVAIHLGVYPNSIRNWMEKNGYRIERTVRVVRDCDEVPHEEEIHV